MEFWIREVQPVLPKRTSQFFEILSLFVCTVMIKAGMG